MSETKTPTAPQAPAIFTIKWDIGVHYGNSLENIIKEIIEENGLSYTYTREPKEYNKENPDQVLVYVHIFNIEYDPKDKNQVDNVNKANREITIFSRRNNRVIDALEANRSRPVYISSGGCLMPILFCLLGIVFLWIV